MQTLMSFVKKITPTFRVSAGHRTRRGRRIAVIANRPLTAELGADDQAALERLGRADLREDRRLLRR